MKKLVVSRKRWLHDSSDGRPRATQMRNAHGSMCITGWYMRSKGVRAVDLKDALAPSEVDKAPALVPELVDFDGEDTGWCTNLVRTNDSRQFTRKQKEQLLKELFLQENVKLRFVP